MTLLTAEARAILAAEAFARDRAIANTGRRHVRVSAEPFVLVPLGLAGEDDAPLAFAWSRGSQDEMQVIVIPEPRSRDVVLLGLEALAVQVIRWLGPIHRSTRASPPQLVVPANASVVLLRMLAERMLRVSDDAPKTIRRAGGWFQFFLERHDLFDDGALLVATEAIRTHWTLPISAAEGGHLLAATAALAASEGGARAAAHRAETYAGGALTMPEFDRTVLHPHIERYGVAADDDERERASAQIARALRPALDRLHQATLEVLERLRAVPPLPSAPARADAGRAAFDRFAAYLRSGGRFARADSLSRSTWLLSDAESELAVRRQQAREGDPVVRAVASMQGAALDGVIARAYAHKVKVRVRATLRVDVEVDVLGPWEPAEGASYVVVWDRAKQPSFEVLQTVYDEEADKTRVVLRTLALANVAKEALSSALAKGSSFAAVVAESAYQSFGFPKETPWMLAP